MALKGRHQSLVVVDRHDGGGRLAAMSRTGQSYVVTLGNLIAGRQLLRLYCACGRIEDLAPGPLAERYGADTLIHDVRDRARCQACGARPCGLQAPYDGASDYGGALGTNMPGEPKAGP